MFASYAQNFEDVMLLRALQNVSVGYYLDIGANDPKQDSVSMAFYERGWSGTNVEPDPGYAEKLRMERPRDSVVEAAIASNSGSIKLHLFTGTGLTTGVDKYADLHREQGHESTEVEVPARTLESVLEDIDARDIHWLKIDVEGMEDDVLNSWNEHSARPWIVVVEATKPNSTILDHARWEPALLQRGYAFEYFDGLNRFYVHDDHSELAVHFDRGPNLHDGFYLNHRSGFVPTLTGQSSIIVAELEQERAAVHAAESTARSLEAQLSELQSTHHSVTDDLNQHLHAEKQASLELSAALEKSQQQIEEQAQQLSQFATNEVDLKQKVAQARKSLRKIERTLKARIKALESNLQKEIVAQADASAEVIELLTEVESATARVHQLEHTVMESTQQRNEAAAELAKLHRSSSWRLTAPVRGVSLAVRKLGFIFVVRPLGMIKSMFASAPVAVAADQGQRSPSDVEFRLTPDPELLSTWQTLLKTSK